jgi:hypothetical protein
MAGKELPMTDERQQLQKEILEKAPRLGPADEFRFSCKPGVSCFTNCCADVNIVLTPYDVLRLKNHMKMESPEFLEKYTISPFTKEQKFPIRLLKMNEDDKKQCPFLGTAEEGCTVYEDRPWSCRMYPVGKASPADDFTGEKDFFFLMEEPHCKGFEEADNEWTVQGWMENQGVADYDRNSEGFKSIVLHEVVRNNVEIAPSKMDIFHQAFYDLDMFRAFIFESSFLEKFEVDAKLLDEMKTSDEALLDFAPRWLRFALFGDIKAMKIKDHILDAKREDLRKTGKLKD